MSREVWRRLQLHPSALGILEVYWRWATENSQDLWSSVNGRALHIFIRGFCRTLPGALQVLAGEVIRCREDNYVTCTSHSDDQPARLPCGGAAPLISPIYKQSPQSCWSLCPASQGVERICYDSSSSSPSSSPPRSATRPIAFVHHPQKRCCVLSVLGDTCFHLFSCCLSIVNGSRRAALPVDRTLRSRCLPGRVRKAPARKVPTPLLDSGVAIPLPARCLFQPRSLPSKPNRPTISASIMTPYATSRTTTSLTKMHPPPTCPNPRASTVSCPVSRSSTI